MSGTAGVATNSKHFSLYLSASEPMGSGTAATPPPVAVSSLDGISA